MSAISPNVISQSGISQNLYKYFLCDNICSNSLWPSDIIWWQRSGSILAQVMACCLMATSHYLNQYWLIIEEVQNSIEGIPQDIPQPVITKIRLRITYLKFNWNFPGVNAWQFCYIWWPAAVLPISWSRFSSLIPQERRILVTKVTFLF